jgi:hypothetical protein
VGKPEGKRPFGRPRCTWEDNIKMDVKEVGWAVRNWIHLVQDRYKWQVLLNVIMNPQVS